MKLSELKRPEGASRQRKRIGRGRGSGRGGTSGRGHKGQKSRSGKNKMPAWFEGGQMPIQRRLPKRGFNNPFRKTYQLVNLSDIERVGKRDSLDPQAMAELGLIRKADRPVKILGDGKISFAVNVSANAFSTKARESIEAAGGKVEVL
jgi:large subunit ribosomal protein L15